MSKPPRLSLTGLVRGEGAETVPSSRDNGTTAQRDNGTPSTKKTERVRPPHTSVYISDKVVRALKEIALAKECKPHDLIVEGIRRVMAENGKDFDALNRKG